jgi:hypothetical protein
VSDAGLLRLGHGLMLLCGGLLNPFVCHGRHRGFVICNAG